jgi:hypothetical protein
MDSGSGSACRLLLRLLLRRGSSSRGLLRRASSTMLYLLLYVLLTALLYGWQGCQPTATGRCAACMPGCRCPFIVMHHTDTKAFRLTAAAPAPPPEATRALVAPHHDLEQRQLTLGCLQTLACNKPHDCRLYADTPMHKPAQATLHHEGARPTAASPAELCPWRSSGSVASQLLQCS